MFFKCLSKWIALGVPAYFLLSQVALATWDEVPSGIETCSQTWDTAAQFVLTNNYSKDVDVYWVRYDCTEEYRTTLKPGQYVSQFTYASHPWRVKDKDGKLLKQFTLQNGKKRVMPVVDECSGNLGWWVWNGSKWILNNVSLKFKNNTGKTLGVYWVDSNCSEVKYKTLKSGEYYEQTTFGSHVWKMYELDANGNKGRLFRNYQAANVDGVITVYAAERFTNDNPDDSSAYQVKAMYVLPSDMPDEQLDKNGMIATSLAAADSWFKDQSGGQKVQFDTYNGTLDIGFVRLSETDAGMLQRARDLGKRLNPSQPDESRHELYLREIIQEELHSLGFNDDGTIYLVYYGGSNSQACGGASYPPGGPHGNVVGLYLKGAPLGFTPCANNQFAANVNETKYWEFSGLHEVFHSLGIVPACAPNSIPGNNSHVGDSPEDLMYAGNQPWTPGLLDVGNDDYFGHSNPNCTDLKDSVFLRPAESGAKPPEGWQ